MFEWLWRFFRRERERERKVEKRKKKLLRRFRRIRKKLRVSDLMTKNVITISPSKNLDEAAEILIKKKITGMPVMDGRFLVGEISEKDILKVVGKDDLKKLTKVERDKLKKVKVSEVMKKPICITEKVGVREAIKKMNELKIRRLLVIDENGNLVGILTKTDLMKRISRRKFKEKIFTKVDEMLKIIEKEGKISIAELSKRMELSQELIESWAKILEDHDLIEISYPTVGSPILKIKGLKE